MKYRMKRHAVVQPQDQSIKLIPLTQGQNAVVDAEDYGRLMQWNWYASWSRNTKGFYAMRHDHATNKSVYIHREVLKDFTSPEIDHGDRNTLNNRKNNLRPCTHFENQANRRKDSGNQSGYKGVSWGKSNNKWQAQINVRGVKRHLGYFATPKEAHKAYAAVAVEEFGQFSRLD